MSVLDILASLPQIHSRRVARDILAELEGRGLAIVNATIEDGEPRIAMIRPEDYFIDAPVTAVWPSRCEWTGTVIDP